jgi:hypothetical protein
MMKRQGATGRAPVVPVVAPPRGRALTKRPSVAQLDTSSSSAAQSQQSMATAAQSPRQQSSQAVAPPAGRGLSRRASNVGTNEKQHHQSPPKAQAQGAGFGGGAKNKSFRELVISEEEALQEVEQLKEKLRAKKAHHQQDAIRAKEVQAQLEIDIAAATQQLAAEKENASALAEIVQSLRQKGTTLLGQLEARGYDGIACRDLEVVDLPDDEVGARLDEMERHLDEARAAIDATMEMQLEEGDFYGSVMQEVQALLGDM